MFARSWIALLAGAATAAVLGRDAAEVIEFSDTIKHAKPVPAGFFESHLKDVGIAAAMTPADTSLRSRDVTHVYVCINVNFQPACENVALNSGACSKWTHGVLQKIKNEEATADAAHSQLRR